MNELKSALVSIVKMYRPSNLNYKYCLPLRPIYADLQKATSFLPEEGTRDTERIYCVLNSITSRITCIICGKPVKYKRGLNGYHEYCSCKCSAVSLKKRAKVIETSMVRFGTKNPAQNDMVKAKIRETNIRKYGAINHSTVDNTKSKFTQLSNQFDKLLSIEHVKPLFEKDEYNGVRNGSKWNRYKWKCIKCSTKFTSTLHFNGLKCPNCNRSRSSIEDEMASHIAIFGHLVRNAVIPNSNGMQIDMLFKDKHVGVELNGMWWHSQLCGKNRNYHLKKTLVANNAGIRLIHIFEPEWLFRRDIVESIIANAVGVTQNRIFARNCEVTSLTRSEYNTFIDDNHIHRSINASTRLGLIYNKQIVSAIGIGNSRFNKNEQEVYRFCNRIGYSVIGALSKLLAHLYSDSDLVTYCDRRLFDGRGFQKAGFEVIGMTPPTYWYFKNNKVYYHRMSFQKHKLRSKLENFDETKSEWENMQANGWNRIWDCGNIKMIMRR